MQTFQDALDQGFTPEKMIGGIPEVYSFKFGDGYELCFERLIFNEQFYVALYKDQSLLTAKVPIKPGKQNDVVQTKNQQERLDV